MFFELKITKISKSGWGTGKEWVAMETEIFVAVGMLPVELLAYQVSMLSAANWPR